MHLHTIGHANNPHVKTRQITETSYRNFHNIYSIMNLFGVNSATFNTCFRMTAHRENMFCIFMDRYCKVPVQKALLGDLLPGPVTLVFERSEELNADLNPFTSVSPLT